jgi:hypothetical protein
MREHGPPAKYLVLPPNIDIKDIVIEILRRLQGIPGQRETFRLGSWEAGSVSGV